MAQTEQVSSLLHALGDQEEPLGIYYTQTPPTGGLTPQSGKGHACIISYMRLARMKQETVWFAADVPGCRGGWVYLGYTLPPPDTIAQFVTTGFPGKEGEKYMPAPASMHRFFDHLDIQPAPAPYCVMKPLSQFTEAEKPLLLTFFARGEALTGLCQLTYFALDDHEAVAMPFGAGCTNVLTWPLHYAQKGLRKAVVGGSDPSCRPFMQVDELSFTVTLDVFETMVEAVPRSFLTTKTWATVCKRIETSRETWKK